MYVQILTPGIILVQHTYEKEAYKLIRRIYVRTTSTNWPHDWPSGFNGHHGFKSYTGQHCVYFTNCFSESEWSLCPFLVCL